MFQIRLMYKGAISYWEHDSFYKPSDIIIIGAGIVGLSSAISLKTRQPNISITILERGRLPHGASTKNAGFACFGSISELIDDLAGSSEQTVSDILKMRWNGLHLLRKRLGDKDLGYQHFGGFEIFPAENIDSLQLCKHNIESINGLINSTLGISNSFNIRKNSFRFNTTTELIFNKYEGQIHSGKMMQALLKICSSLGINVLFGHEVSRFEADDRGVEVEIKDGPILKATQLLISTNAFALSLLPDVKLQPGRNQVLITKPIQNLHIKGCFHYDKGYVYFRNVGDRLLIGGGRNMSQEEETSTFGTTDTIKGYLRDLIKNVILPGHMIEEDTWWSGIIAVGKDKRPILKQVQSNVFAAVKLGGMGIAIGSDIGDKAAKLMLG